MKRLILAGLLAATAVLLVAPASSLGAEVNAAYVGCSLDETAAPASSCVLGDKPGAFFEVDEDVEYKVCVFFPNADFECLEEVPAEADTLSIVEVEAVETGRYLVSWYLGEGVNEEEVAEAEFNVLAPPPPPAPPAPAPVVTPPVVTAPPTIAPTKPSAACNKARGRVTRLKARLKKADAPKAKTKIRSSLIGARGSVKKAC